MHDKFDELTKAMAQSVTRRGALRKFSLGLVGVIVAALGLPTKAQAAYDKTCLNKCSRDCARRSKKGTPGWQYCYFLCSLNCPIDEGGV